MFGPQLSTMAPAAPLAVLVLCLHFFTASTQVLPERRPHITGCVSNNMETFRCRWNVGTFQNLSEPGALRLFYFNKIPSPDSPKNWSECPHYSTERPNECFFNKNHTTVWTIYSVQLHSADRTVLYDEDLFYVQDIVQPDPAFSLNWTLLNVSSTGTHYDIMLSWKPPESADVGMGWMRLQYEVQHRDVNSDLWKASELVLSTHRSLYGLQTNVNHEVRVRCKMHAAKDFGEFSDSVFVHIPSKVSRFPVVALLIFGALCLLAILMLVLISQQEKLMFILLPPVPGPKIRGIDSELLKKGKLRELTSILGGPPDLRPELYNSDSWVEFIDLDIEEQSDRLTELDTDCLVERSLFYSCSPLSIGFRDDDSGRASCCDPDLPIDSDVSPFNPLIPNQTLSKEASEPSSPTAAETPSTREALYTQVTEVRSSGKVLLAPEEQTDLEKTTSKDSEKDSVVEKEKEKNDFRLMLVSADNGGYTSELKAGKMSPSLSDGDLSERRYTVPSPYYEADPTAMSPLPSPPVYTVVEGVDGQNSLLLTSNSTPVPQIIIPKPMPTPDGYLTPDLLGSVTP
ncbi:growth hormone receptor b isoform X1 [Hippoglossus stenolepis]|uniref:growth hormone receptor b isoform X1 n=3 Tax=Hippoglossus stenolepis TaxID=195615 RepID=UPI00159C8716|nr:growth hormone receptor b isoform X1 [Hippoglossus stenolepis]XP_035040007.1 growth hormone receptor b isoform X1 [Hippoglossus stenolepis]XP_035040008.1 growth hormone receptor b isoform X1 [Hippoglossus stenolepis]